MTLRNIFILAAWVLAACHVSFETYLSLSLYRHFLSLTQQIYLSNPKHLLYAREDVYYREDGILVEDILDFALHHCGYFLQFSLMQKPTLQRL